MQTKSRGPRLAKRCRSCRQRIKLTAIECPHCGHAERRCNYCGTAVSKHAVRCDSCQNKI